MWYLVFKILRRAGRAPVIYITLCVFFCMSCIWETTTGKIFVHNAFIPRGHTPAGRTITYNRLGSTRFLRKRCHVNCGWYLSCTTHTRKRLSKITLVKNVYFKYHNARRTVHVHTVGYDWRTLLWVIPRNITDYAYTPLVPYVRRVRINLILILCMYVFVWYIHTPPYVRKGSLRPEVTLPFIIHMYNYLIYT